MKLNVAGAKATGSGVEGSHQFSMAVNAKAFHTLSSTLYKDKFGAIIREICSNAYDAHAMVGNTERPFSLIFPDAFDPELVIRDYGPGISPEDIYAVYCCLFESTKDNDNNVVGAFGLGSKTPFSYTDTFTVTSIYKGVKRIYTAFKDEGMPNIQLMAEVETEEESGLEVSIPVDTRDFSAFEVAVLRELRFFEVKPVSNREWSWPSMETTMDFGTVRFYKSASKHLQGFFTQIGPVGYRVDREIITEYCNNNNITMSAMTKYLLGMGGYGPHNAILNMPIGTIEVQPSREGLHYTNETCQNILDAIHSAEELVANEMVQQLDDAYAQGGKQFFEMVSGLPSFVAGSLHNIDDFSKKYAPFSVDSKGLKVVWDESIIGSTNQLQIGKIFTTSTGRYGMTTTEKTETYSMSYDVLSRNDGEVSFRGLELFKTDTVYFKDEAFAYKSRIRSEDTSSVSYFLEPRADQDVDALIAYFSQYLNIRRVSDLPKKAKGGKSITGGNKRSWFTLGDSLANCETSKFSKNKTLYASNVGSVFGESLNDITESTIVVRTFDNFLDFPIQEFDEKVSLVAMLQEAGYNVIAIPKNQKYDNENLCELDNLTDDHINKLRALLDDFTKVRVLSEAHSFVHKFNNAVATMVGFGWSSADISDLKLSFDYIKDAIDAAPKISQMRTRSDLDAARKVCGGDEVSITFDTMDELFDAVKKYTGVSVVPSDAFQKFMDSLVVKKILIDFVSGESSAAYYSEFVIRSDLVKAEFCVSAKQFVESWVKGLD